MVWIIHFHKILGNNPQISSINLYFLLFKNDTFSDENLIYFELHHKF